MFPRAAAAAHIAGSMAWSYVTSSCVSRMTYLPQRLHTLAMFPSEATDQMGRERNPYLIAPAKSPAFASGGTVRVGGLGSRSQSCYSPLTDELSRPIRILLLSVSACRKVEIPSASFHNGSFSMLGKASGNIVHQPSPFRLRTPFRSGAITRTACCRLVCCCACCRRCPGSVATLN
jgi:hypothetical protein